MNISTFLAGLLVIIAAVAVVAMEYALQILFIIVIVHFLIKWW